MDLASPAVSGTSVYANGLIDFSFDVKSVNLLLSSVLDQMLKLISQCRWPRILISSGSVASYLFEAGFPAPEVYHQKIWRDQQIVNKVISALSPSGAAQER